MNTCVYIYIYMRGCIKANHIVVCVIYVLYHHKGQYFHTDGPPKAFFSGPSHEWRVKGFTERTYHVRELINISASILSYCLVQESVVIFHCPTRLIMIRCKISVAMTMNHGQCTDDFPLCLSIGCTKQNSTSCDPKWRDSFVLLEVRMDHFQQSHCHVWIETSTSFSKSIPNTETVWEKHPILPASFRKETAISSVISYARSYKKIP